jgi:hypothetical protein
MGWTQPKMHRASAKSFYPWASKETALISAPFRAANAVNGPSCLHIYMPHPVKRGPHCRHRNPESDQILVLSRFPVTTEDSRYILETFRGERNHILGVPAKLCESKVFQNKPRQIVEAREGVSSTGEGLVSVLGFPHTSVAMPCHLAS